MLPRLSAIAALIAGASAIKLLPPVNPHVGSPIDVVWTNEAGDPASWTLFLMNISTSFDLKANFGVIDPKPQTVHVTLSSRLVPHDDYVLYAVNNTNWDWVFASSGRFTILPPV